MTRDMDPFPYKDFMHPIVMHHFFLILTIATQGLTKQNTFCLVTCNANAGPTLKTPSNKACY